MIFALLVLVGVWAGTQNALAGGGSFITLPALILAGLDPRAANITSTLALFPAQVVTGWGGRKLVADVPGLSFRTLLLISLAGGAAGALLLLGTSAKAFEAMVPWLVLAATGVFAWGSFRRKRVPHPSETLVHHPVRAAAAQVVIAIYGGYFGGGIGFLMLAVLTMSGQVVRNGIATKNVLAAVINASAVAVFAFSRGAHWLEGAMLGAGAIAGGMLGNFLLGRINERALRAVVVVIGILLTIGLFVRRARGG